MTARYPDAVCERTPKANAAVAGRMVGLALLGLSAAGAAPVSAQFPTGAGGTSAPTVTWTAAAQTTSVRAGGRAVLVLNGAVREGWHVYALKQLPNGPTPLHVTLDPNAFATPAGAPAGSQPITAHDAAFNLDTPYYARAFTVSLPVRINPRLVAGRQAIPVSVRFQTCNGQTCQPPKTVRITVPVDVDAGR